MVLQVRAGYFVSPPMGEEPLPVNVTGGGVGRRYLSIVYDKIVNPGHWTKVT